MRVSKIGNLVVGVLGLSLTLVVACSDDPTVTPAPSPVQTCLGTFSAANEASCFVNGFSCPYPLDCPTGFQQQATCTCNGTKFVCTASDGETIAKGAAPECKSTQEPNPDACPASLAAAEGKACKVVGTQCPFAGTTCSDGTKNIDLCQCTAGDAGNFLFVCSKRVCPSGTVVDASTDAASGG
jgi:hypothetical protein